MSTGSRTSLSSAITADNYRRKIPPELSSHNLIQGSEEGTPSTKILKVPFSKEENIECVIIPNFARSSSLRY